MCTARCRNSTYPGQEKQCDSVMTRGQQAQVSISAHCEELESFKNLSFGAGAMVSPLGLIHLDFPVFTNKLVPVVSVSLFWSIIDPRL